MGKLTMVKAFVWSRVGVSVCGGGPSSGRRWYLHPQQLICKDVPEDGEEEEGDEGEDDDPPGALFLQTLLVAAENQQPHADTDHGP